MVGNLARGIMESIDAARESKGGFMRKFWEAFGRWCEKYFKAYKPEQGDEP